MIAQRDAISPGANVEAYKVNKGIVGVESEGFSPEERRVRMAKAQGHKRGNGEVAGD